MKPDDGKALCGLDLVLQKGGGFGALGRSEPSVRSLFHCISYSSYCQRGLERGMRPSRGKIYPVDADLVLGGFLLRYSEEQQEHARCSTQAG